MKITDEQIQQAKAKLEETRAKLEAEIEKLESPSSYDMGPADEGYDEDTEADEAEALGASLGAASTIKARHESVVTALSKIDRGVYGKCEKSGKDIEWEVLSVNPEAKYCKEYIKEA